MKFNSLHVLSAGVLAVAMSTGVQAQGEPKLSHQDSSFLKDASEANNAEVAASQMALTQSTNGDVKSFAQMMVDDHTKAESELTALAQQKGVKVSEKPSLTQQAEAKMLSERKGASFDQHYADSIGISAHKDAVKLFQKEADKGTDADTKAWATKMLPALKHHLALAQELKAKTDAEGKK